MYIIADVRVELESCSSYYIGVGAHHPSANDRTSFAIANNHRISVRTPQMWSYGALSPSLYARGCAGAKESIEARV
jgi:hypothetical protein